MPEVAGLIPSARVFGEYRVRRFATALENVKALVPGDTPPDKSTEELAGLRTFTAIAGAKLVFSELVNAFSVFAACAGENRLKTTVLEVAPLSATEREAGANNSFRLAVAPVIVIDRTAGASPCRTAEDAGAIESDRTEGASRLMLTTLAVAGASSFAAVLEATLVLRDALAGERTRAATLAARTIPPPTETNDRNLVCGKNSARQAVNRGSIMEDL